MNLYIPSIGDCIILTEDFSFNVMKENRNTDFLKAMGLMDQDDKRYYFSNVDKNEYFQVLLPKGVILKIDRIYIKKGMSKFDSITFYVDKKSVPFDLAKGKLRFWVNLCDINNKMQIEQVKS